MSGIAGIAKPGCVAEVAGMLSTIAHRGRAGWDTIEVDGVCLGAVSAVGKRPALDVPGSMVRDETGPARFARAQVREGRLVLSRDPIGVAPLYHGLTADGALCFASEAKALLPITDHIEELPPGTTFDGERLRVMPPLTRQLLSNDTPETLARQLRLRLQEAIARVMGRDTVGSWLSGGLDSSVMVALARPMVERLHTFAGGLAGAPDLAFAKDAAGHLQTRHHEIVLTLRDLLRVLPEVIASLESFDALLVRSSLVNHLVAKAAADHVDAALSGEGGDELFAGYAYLKGLPLGRLGEELADITGRLHNTALQRVDRSAARHGLTIHTCFLDPDVVALAFRIPSEYKIRGGVEKWILRRAVDGLLPEAVVERPKAKFWEGAGVESLLADHAESEITDGDFRSERRLPNGWILDSKEELMYYRLFRERFGDLKDLEWMGRTKRLVPA